MDEVKIEQFCLENKQSAATSCSSVSEGSCSVAFKSPGICSPTTTTSPSQLHRRISGPIRRAKGGWTPDEDETLRNVVEVFMGKSWKKIEGSCSFAFKSPGICSPITTTSLSQLHWTDNSIKNHWNSSLKKKLNFYLATGELPPVPKNPENVAKDTSRAMICGNFLGCSKKSTSQTSSEAEDLCKVEEDCKDQLRFSTPQFLVTNASTGIQLIGLTNSNDVEWMPQTSKLDLGSNSYSTPKLIKSKGGETDRENKIDGTIVQLGIATFGSLYYEPPQLENCGISLDSSLLQTYWPMQETNSSSSDLSANSYFTLPCAKASGLSGQSPESILKNAAKSFPNTPSILRKRNREDHSLQFPDRGGQTDGIKVKDNLCTPKVKQRTGSNQEHSDSPKSCLYKTPASHSNGTIGLYNRMAFNSSPPYRLSLKQTALLKSVGKQLEFTLDKDKLDRTTSMNLVKGGTHVTEECSQTRKTSVT